GLLAAGGGGEIIVLSGDDPNDVIVPISPSQPAAIIVGYRRIVEQTRVLPVRLDRVAPGNDRRDVKTILGRLVDDRIDIGEEKLVRLGRVDVSFSVMIVGFIVREDRALYDVETLCGARPQIQIHAIGCYTVQSPPRVARPKKGS